MLKKSFRVESEKWDIIVQLAKQAETTPSRVIRTILDEYLKYYEVTQNEKTK